MGSTADDNSGALSPAAAPRQRKASSSSGGGQQVIRCEGGVSFTVTEGNEVAEVARGGARVLGSESFLDEATGTRRHHFVDVQGKKEAMMFLVSVDEDQRRIVDIKRCS